MKSIIELIQTADLNKVFGFLTEKSTYPHEDPPTYNEILLSYSKTINELVSFIDKADKNDQDKIIVSVTKKDKFNEEDYISVYIENADFDEHPPKDLMPWGGDSDVKNDCPEGYYNCNWNGYHDLFGMCGKDRHKLLFKPIGVTSDVYEFLKNEGIPEKNYDEYIFAEVLFEITFYGFLEEKADKFWKDMEERVEEAEDSISLEEFKNILKP